MPLLDDFLRLLGTNRTRIAWKLRAWRRGWDRRFGTAKNRVQAVTYSHQACPKCSHPAGADEKLCSRCGEPLGGRTAHRLRRLSGLVWVSGTPVVATVLIISIISIYATMLIWGRQVGLTHGLAFSPHSYALTRFGSMQSASVAAGEWWRLQTSNYLHFDVIHLALNVGSLWIVTVFLEDALGRSKTFALYATLGVIASLTSFVWHTRAGGGVNGAGASGAVCGLIGVAVGFCARRRNVALHMRRYYVGWAVLIFLMALSSWHVDNAAHFGGFAAGVLAGLVVRRRGETSPAARLAWRAGALAGVAAVITAFGFAAANPLPDTLIDAADATAGMPSAVTEAPYRDPDSPAVAAAIAVATARFERVAAVDHEPLDGATWTSFHPPTDLYTYEPAELLGRMRRLFGEPAAGRWIVRERATGGVLVINDANDSNMIWSGSADAAAAGRRLAGLLDRVPPADFSMIIDGRDGLRQIGASAGRASDTEVDYPTALAFVDGKVAAAHDDGGRADAELGAIGYYLFEGGAPAADRAHFTGYWQDVVAVAQRMADHRAAQIYLDDARTLAEPLGIAPADVDKLLGSVHH